MFMSLSRRSLRSFIKPRLFETIQAGGLAVRRSHSTASEGENTAKKRGVLNYHHGFMYDGELLHGVPNGQGKLTSRDGKVFEGEFVNGVLQGQPRSFTTPWYHYEGDTLAGKPHGRGKMTYQNGEVWVGEFCESILIGRGKITYPNGKATEGAFKKNLVIGSRLHCYPDVLRVEAEYVDGKWDGIVKQFYPKGVTLETFFVRGEQMGPERHTRSDGLVIVGQYLPYFIRSNPFRANYSIGFHLGPCKLIYPCGTIREGEMKYTLPVGHWVSTYTDGTVNTEVIPMTFKDRALLAWAPFARIINGTPFTILVVITVVVPGLKQFAIHFFR